MLKDAGVHSWATEPAFADPVSPCFYVTWVNEGNGNVVASTWQQFLLSTPGLVLIGLIVIMFLWLFFPGFAEMVQMIMAMGFMFIMMYFMTQMMAAVYPAMKPTAEKEKELIRQAKAGSSKALAELKSLAEKGVSWAEKAWEEITR
jgi:type III secretory pathway component EscV